jgi:hypothetical protein
VKGSTVNSNQLMLNRAIVAQTALRDEALASRRRARNARPRGAKTNHRILGLLRRR